jgi:hypothetical protein
MNILNKLKELDLTPNEYVVVGSGILEVLGIRYSSDIDIAVTRNLFNKLQQTGDYEEEERYGKIFLKKEGIDVIPQLDWDKYKTTTEEAIASAMVIEGLYFMNLDELCKFKTALGRDKDFKDIEGQPHMYATQISDLSELMI